MARYTFKRRASALCTLMGLGIVMPLALGTGTAHAQAQLQITKTHKGDFTRGGQGTYVITVTNSGDQTTEASLSDFLPTGLTVRPYGPVITASNGTDISISNCLYDANSFDCNSVHFSPGGSYTLEATVDVLADAPCSVSNTATITDDLNGSKATATDTAPITGGGCGNSGGSGGGNSGSILPINLSGILPLFNNIATNSNIYSPGASNVADQTFGLNTP
ncbi:DUF11 domain-containing protein [Kitasatospora sp. NBC_00240]|uniref:hypothetical protein n=1 Tax=Kitasatospora sp. NBC_00240 TaxID=2903567 RepID=UPI00224F528B|nr:hypothetical protein [Kitasatospora sp. NBC_00240]MCX5215986.1 DUF11 domain-containing protein [Kitasatospora sp. NBC_00240]